MMTAATSNHAAEVEQVKFIARRNSLGNITHKTLKRAAAAQHSRQNVAGIYLCQSSRGQFKHVVGRVISQHAYYNYIARAGRMGLAGHHEIARQVKRRSPRSDLVYVNHL